MNFKPGKLIKFLMIGVFSLFLSTNLFAQGNGSIFGKIVDSSTGEELIGANILLEGTTIGAASDIEGNYRISNLSPGNFSLIVSMIGYSKMTVTDVEIKHGENKKVDLSLRLEAIETEEVVITAEALKNTETSVLKIQKNSANIVDGVSSELISKNNSSDGTDILKRMTGVTISDGKYAYVRGVGDRYNNTLLNGASLPSTDPEKKSFSYDIIPAGMVENLITAKTFTPDKPGDFTGGLVQISTIEFPNKFMLNVSTSAGYNSNSTFNSFTTYSGGSRDFLGFDDGTRSMPDIIDQTRVVRGNYSNDELNEIGLSFKNNWNTNPITAPINGNIKLSVGDKVEFGEDLFGYIASFDYSNATSTVDRSKNFYDFEGARYLYDGISNTNSVLMSGLLNLSYRLGANNKISFKNLYNQNSDDETTIYKGEYRAADQYREITSLRFVSRNLQSHQLVGNHFFDLMNGLVWDWGASYSKSERNEPDARRYIYSRALDEINEPLYFQLDQSNVTRFYSELVDNDYNFITNFSIKPFVNPQLPKISFGTLYNKKDRVFDARIFGFRNNAGGVFVEEDSILQLSIENIFKPENINPTFISVTEITRPSDSYSAFQKIAAGYFMFDATLINSFRLVAGARYEYSEQFMDSYTITNEPVIVKDYYRDWLPGINLTYLLNEKINIRLAFSKTLARPEFREKAPFSYFDFLANELVQGNPDLKRALITNYDLRFELFPGAGELVALSVFYKHFENPIELILIASSSYEPIRSYQNANSADNIGVELELRKNLGFIGEMFNNFSFITNLSFIDSKIKIEEGNGNGFQENERPLQGQANYIINLGLYYDNFELGLNSAITYNRVGERISQVGFADLGDIVERPADLIDFNISKRIFEQFNVKLSVMDILNQDKNLIQRTLEGDKIAQSMNNGRTFKIGISYQL
jgi:outer membrane receptor protein involved in Fe transport